MTTRDWRVALADAARLAGATAEAARIAPLLEARVRGDACDADAVAAALRTLEASLDNAVRSQRATWDAATLATARVGLRMLPRLVWLVGMPSSGSEMAEHFEIAANGPSDEGAPTAQGWRCPRCGSYHVDEEHTETPLGHWTDLRCEVCSFDVGFNVGEGAALESAWRG